ncbi:hypothetical protein BKA62DRAFT_702069 [Auriculariales sp. MPI-PUGE-AT-0066]|nr:hypothetical protein BKA62DRAFT_702069 [Auriculariales sp. MPI-PUGE-AT-0066]
MSQKQPYGKGAPPKYLNDFSKALASEVRILLQEVGKLRDERRQLQQEIAELMAVKAKHGLPGGEYAPPTWMLPAPPPPEPEHAPPAELGPPVEAKPGWRTVHKKPERRPREPKALPAPPPPPVAAPAPMPDPGRGLPSWAQWRPNPHLQPTPGRRGSPLPVPPTPRPQGLFGSDD